MLERLKAAVKAFQKGAEEDTKEQTEAPRVEILGIVHDPNKGVKIDLDWNDEFANYLRENGILSDDDEVVVQKWLTMLLRDMMEQDQEETTNAE